MKIAQLATLIACCVAHPVIAQDCTIGAFADADGSQHLLYPIEGQLTSVYVVLFAEDAVAAAAYRLVYEQQPCGPYLQLRLTGPSGRGLVINEPTGTNSALAECVIGFEGRPVLIDEYQFLFLPCYYPTSPDVFSIEPNVNQNPDFPVYVTCNDIIRDCEIGPDLRIPVSTDARSFGAVKSLYHKD